MTSQGKVKLQVWSLIVIVFVLGGVTGGSLDRLYTTKRDITPSSSTNHNSPPGRPRGPGRMLERMKNDLNLNEEQVVRIRAIFDESRKEFPPSRFAECPGYKESRERTRARVREALTPEQQKRYDEFNAQRDAEMKAQRDAEAGKER
jgi:Spy/CpxP family protein refolding chaperone